MPAVSVVQLSYLDLVLAALLIAVNGALSVSLQLRMERQLVIAATRMCVQLLLIGLVLTKL